MWWRDQEDPNRKLINSEETISDLREQVRYLKQVIATRDRKIERLHTYISRLPSNHPIHTYLSQNLFYLLSFLATGGFFLWRLAQGIDWQGLSWIIDIGRTVAVGVLGFILAYRLNLWFDRKRSQEQSVGPFFADRVVIICLILMLILFLLDVFTLYLLYLPFLIN